MNNFDALPDVEFNRFVLEKARIATQLPIDSYTLNSMRASVEDDMNFFVDQILLRLEAFVLQDKLPPKTVEETYTYTTPPVPATWWEHFKHSKLGKGWVWAWVTWLKPPLYTAETKKVTLKVDLDRWISYPEAQNIPDTFGRQYKGYNIKNTLWDS